MDSRDAFALRVARGEDVPVLSALIARSVRELHRDDYSESQIEKALAAAYGIDSALIRDGTYFVVEASGVIAACGGWSKRKTLHGGDQFGRRDDALLDPAVDAARIRAFYVDPRFVRRGLGSLLLDASERAAREAGFRRFELGATLTGARLFARHGYTETGRETLALPGDELLPVVLMSKID